MVTAWILTNWIDEDALKSNLANNLGEIHKRISFDDFGFKMGFT